jgi:hypothetical protein
MATEVRTHVVSFGARKLVTNLFFGLLTLGASRELATPHTREQPSRAESLENHDDGDGLVAVKRGVRSTECC